MEFNARLSLWIKVRLSYWSTSVILFYNLDFVVLRQSLSVIELLFLVLIGIVIIHEMLLNIKKIVGVFLVN